LLIYGLGVNSRHSLDRIATAGVGIHVHVHDGQTRLVDETYAEVTLEGKALERSSLIKAMIDRSVI
jgi:hypothetical protein